MIIKRIFVYVLIVFALPACAYAAAMSSSNYSIQIDSVNIGGGNSVSSSYAQESTVGEIGTGNSNSASYYLYAGYQQMTTAYLSLSSPADIALANINGLTGGSSVGSADWNVITSSSGGYTLTIQASTNPALKASSGASFADYTTATANPDFNFSINSSDSEFGFTPEGPDIDVRYKDNGATCNTGSSDTADKCWDSLSTSPKTISLRTTNNLTSGSTTTVKFRAESGSAHIQDSGAYSATITVTATAL